MPGHHLESVLECLLPHRLPLCRRFLCPTLANLLFFNHLLPPLLLEHILVLVLVRRAADPLYCADVVQSGPLRRPLLHSISSSCCWVDWRLLSSSCHCRPRLVQPVHQRYLRLHHHFPRGVSPDPLHVVVWRPASAARFRVLGLYF